LSQMFCMTLQTVVYYFLATSCLYLENWVINHKRAIMELREKIDEKRGLDREKNAYIIGGERSLERVRAERQKLLSGEDEGQKSRNGIRKTAAVQLHLHIKQLIMNLRHFFLTGLSALILAACTTDNTSHTRGAGIYPGSLDEYDGPIAASAGNELRNLALMRAAWASSSIDYNLTAQLVTDGIISGEKPCLVETITSEGHVPRNMREKLLDNHKNTRVNIKGNPPYVIFHFMGGLPAYADRMTADATFLSGPDGRRSPARAVFEASEDGEDWFPFEGGSYPWYKATFPETGLVNIREVNFIKDGHSAQFDYDNRHENS
ncbi:MAG: hypothetical protein IJ840_10190, partial [Bacteroidales bacterium]|nr:hypothetical protein [Bacteroidales bacterium]